MSNIERLQPIVTIEQAVAYDPRRPETKTASRVVNILVEAIGEIRPFQLATLATRLGTTTVAITGALQFDTGLRFQDFMDEWRQEKLKEIFRTDPKLDGNELALHLGFENRSSLSAFQKKFGVYSQKQKERQEFDRKAAEERRKIRELLNRDLSYEELEEELRKLGL